MSLYTEEKKHLPSVLQVENATNWKLEDEEKRRDFNSAENHSGWKAHQVLNQQEAHRTRWWEEEG